MSGFNISGNPNVEPAGTFMRDHPVTDGLQTSYKGVGDSIAESHFSYLASKKDDIESGYHISTYLNINAADSLVTDSPNQKLKVDEISVSDLLDM